MVLLSHFPAILDFVSAICTLYLYFKGISLQGMKSRLNHCCFFHRAGSAPIFEHAAAGKEYKSSSFVQSEEISSSGSDEIFLSSSVGSLI